MEGRIDRKAAAAYLPLSSLRFLLELLMPAGGALLQIPLIFHLQGSKVKTKVEHKAFTKR